MSYLVLARKYRPQIFEDIVGQEHITEILKKTILAQRLGQAYLFCGPRGIGKTSCARIFAKSLNCQDGPTARPCGVCPSCVEITAGRSFDVIEIDGASNRGIDEIRTLRENVKFAPSYGQYKIYIVDEVHMLTSEAFNALLKTLEEPPEHAKFIFATTEPHKVPATILSRCQRFDFKYISVHHISETLQSIAQQESLTVEAKALFAIAKAATGSLRDALSILDQLSALADRSIQAEDVASMLGLVEVDRLFEIADHLAKKKCLPCLEILNTLLEQGKDLKQLLRNLVEHFRNLMVIKIGGKALSKLVEYPPDLKERLWQQGQKFSLEDILRAIDVMIETQEMARVMDSIKMCLEIAMVRLSQIHEAPSATSGREPSQAKKTFSPDILSKKGHLDFSPAPKPAIKDPLSNEKNLALASEHERDNVQPKPMDSVEITLDNIRRLWDSLTSAVSKKRMSVATYLLEGDPHVMSGNKLTVGFSQEALFHKEALDDKQHRELIESVFEEQLKHKIKIDFCIVDQQSPKDEEPFVKTTLKTFQGKVMQRWHQDRK